MSTGLCEDGHALFENETWSDVCRKLRTIESKLQSLKYRFDSEKKKKLRSIEKCRSTVKMDRTVRMSQLWGECRYCPKFPEKNVQNSKKMYKNKKKMCKNKKNVQYSDDPGITSGHMLEVLA